MFRLTAAGLALVVALVTAKRIWRSISLARKGLRDPPGPPQSLVLGNLRDVPTHDAHVAYSRMAEKYDQECRTRVTLPELEGPLFQLKLPTQNIVIISSSKVAFDLLEKRGAIYSDRPAFRMAELMGWGFNLTFKRHNDSWRARRRLLHQHMHVGTVTTAKHARLQTHTALVLAKMLLLSPERYAQHIRRSAAANVVQTSYGIDVALEDDPYVEMANEAIESLSPALFPGTFAIDWIPALKHLPSWFPGAKFKRDAAEWSKYPNGLVNIPFDRVLREIEAGTARPSMLSENLAQRSDPDEEWITTVKEAAAVMYFAGSDTTISTILSFVLEMVLHPEVVQKAHDEIDRVVGRDRLPTFDDRESLPYIEAIMREVYRLYPVATLGVAHATEDDDVYEGMLIEKGSTVMTNIWHILRDPTVYPNPHVFDPERFLRRRKADSENCWDIDEQVPDSRRDVFGYGRRICAGKYFADTSIYITVVTMLACFNIASPTDGNPPTGEMHHGIVSTPAPFECSITPRTPKVGPHVEDAIVAYAA
ncbi:cytochrome P450 [Exidia glandulosa HHB12029]|uniref:Cytochrome P450 n=1 Tax=Exidia glandulosa HHB12029 TaxID=1314781 RepID=A0A165HNP3_EXIGL|nr:cytochrome P450 [Exidia glandulosa HHB12029]